MARKSISRASKVPGKIFRANNGATTRGKETDVSVAFTLSPTMHKKLTSFCSERGTTSSAVLRVALSMLLRSATITTLSDTVRFGKYSGEKLESIIRIDPHYIDWALNNVQSFNIDEAAVELLDSMLAVAPKRKSA